MNDYLRETVQPLAEERPAVDGREASVWDICLGISRRQTYCGFEVARGRPRTDRARGRTDRRDPCPAGLFFARGADRFYATDLDKNIAVRCMDWPRLTQERQTALARQGGEAASMFDSDAITSGDFRSECEAGQRTRPEIEAPETLVVSGWGPGNTA